MVVFRAGQGSLFFCGAGCTTRMLGHHVEYKSIGHWSVLSDNGVIQQAAPLTCSKFKKFEVVKYITRLDLKCAATSYLDNFLWRGMFCDGY